MGTLVNLVPFTFLSSLNGMRVYHNYIRPHEGLNGKTPAEACGIELKGDNKWITLIQNASRKTRQFKFYFEFFSQSIYSIRLLILQVRHLVGRTLPIPEWLIEVLLCIQYTWIRQ
jgi:hypothetical protein